jgi:hypothetical protein
LSPQSLKIELRGQLLNTFKKLEPDQQLAMNEKSEPFVVNDFIHQQPFNFDIQLKRCGSSFPNNCELFLFYRSSSRISILFDIVCPQFKYELVNQDKQFSQMNDCCGQPIFLCNKLKSSNFNIFVYILFIFDAFSILVLY